MTQFVAILAEHDAPFCIQPYPYYAVDDDLLKFCLGEESRGGHQSMLEAQYDAVSVAMKKVFNGALPKVDITETGWPSMGPGGDKVATLENITAYARNTIRQMSDSTSSLYQQKVFWFEAFDEDKKDPTHPEARENHYGWFYG